MGKLRPSTRKCRNCSGSFHPKRSSQVYCNDDCREAYYKKTYYSIEPVRKVCLNCGTTFETTCPKKQDYCSPECREDNAAKRRDNKTASINAEKQTFLEDRYQTFVHDNFTCRDCGRKSMDGIALDVEEREGELVTVCKDCKLGRKSIKDMQDMNHSSD